MIARTLFIILVTLLIGYMPSIAENVEDTKAEVPALYDFHEIIYVVWHEAWPAKDIKQLEGFVPGIEKAVVEIEKAKLPGILREKQDKWNKGVKDLKDVSLTYKKAALAHDSVGLLSAAEKLHAQYEFLVRVINPSMKELQAFHESLYKLYHYYMPEYNYDKIKEAVAELNTKITDLMKAEIPKKVAKKSDKFNEARTKLKTSLDALIGEVKAGNNKEKINKAIETMHTDYQALENVFN